MNYELLSKINKPEDIKSFNQDKLLKLCEEIRGYLIETISKTGGHLASNLGTVELTVALHKIFDCPRDKLVFDVGHQCYTHKLLTGRMKDFPTLRQRDGISGFPKPSESIYDSYITGHASTSISVAYGMACGFALEGSDNHAVAIIGDGAFTGGEAYEALNNAGRSKTRLIVILNHNDMSISKNVGGLARYLSKIRSGPAYLRMKRGIDRILSHVPLVGKPVGRWLEHSKSFLKTVIYRSTFFEEMGFQYFGPVDGHDIKGLLRVLKTAKDSTSPVLIQVETTKGKGYEFAEKNPGAYHAISGFDILNGGDNVTMSDCYSNAVGAELTEMASKNNKICAITAAMKYGTGLHTFYSAHKNRFFDVGIAEAHAVTFAGGLASEGFIPVFCVYSSFLQRSYDQLIHDLSIDKKHVVLCIDRAGIVGEDGETHQGIFDVAFLSGIPDLTIYSPEGYEETLLCLKQAVNMETGVVAVRYPRGADKAAHKIPPNINFSYVPAKIVEDGKAGKKYLIISYGRIFSNCFKAHELLKEKGIEVSLLKLCRLSGLDDEVISIASEYENVLFVEEGIKTGGIAEQMAAKLLCKGSGSATDTVRRYRILAIEGFVKQASIEDALKELCMDEHSIAAYLTEDGN